MYLRHLKLGDVEEELGSSLEAQTHPEGTAVEGCQLFTGPHEIQTLLELTAQVC